MVEIQDTKKVKEMRERQQLIAEASIAESAKSY
jgi:hypothetical protein